MARFNVLYMDYLNMVNLLYSMKHCTCHKLVAILTVTGVGKPREVANRVRQVVQGRHKSGCNLMCTPAP